MCAGATDTLMRWKICRVSRDTGGIPNKGLTSFYLVNHTGLGFSKGDWFYDDK